MRDKAAILVLDDEEGIRYTFEIFLSNEGHEVVTACDYNEAMDILSGKKFDLVYADIILGGKTGIDFAEELRRRDINCPIVIITGDPTAKSFSDAIKVNALEYIAKPVGKDKLLQVTRKALYGEAGS